MKLILFALVFILLNPPARADKHLIPANQEVGALGGTGYDSETQNFRGVCLAGSFEAVGWPESSISFDNVISKSQLASELGFGASGAYRFGAGSISASANFLSTSSSNSFSISYIYSGNYKFKNLLFNPSGLTPIGQQVQPNDDRWRNTCGDEFVWQIVRGARLFFTVRLDFSSSEEMQSFDAAFSYSSTFTDVSTHLKTSQSRFSQNTSVTIRALQVGGQVDKVSEVFGKYKDGKGSAVVQCSLGNFAECDRFLQAATEYATSTDTGFPSQLKAEPNGKSDRADLTYVTESYSIAGYYPIMSPVLNAAVKSARQEVEALFNDNLEAKDRASLMLRSKSLPLSSRQKGLLSEAEKILINNVKNIIDAAQTCYNTPVDCVAAVNGLKAGPAKLVAVNPDVFNIIPETFLQYCRLAGSPVAKPSLKETMEGLVAAAKKINPASFEGQNGDKFPIDICLATDGVLKNVKKLDLSRLKIQTLLPLQDLVNIESWDLSENQLGNLVGIEKLINLTELTANHSDLREITGVESLSHLQRLNLRSNYIRDTRALLNKPALARVDLRGNYGAACPAEFTATCLNSNYEIDAQFYESMDLGPNSISLASAADLGKGKFLLTGPGLTLQQASAFILNTRNDSVEAIPGFGTARDGHTSTTLSDGRVAIIGGYGTSKAIMYYDIGRKIFIPSRAVLKTERADHQATLLDNGKVLLTGGFKGLRATLGSYVNNTAEVFDPETETSVVVNMRSARGWHTATRLNDGRVVVIGGVDLSGNAIRSAEIFDPATNTFKQSASLMKNGRGGHTATLLSSGEIFLVGGMDALQQVLDNSEIFDPKNERFTQVQEPMNTPRVFHSALLNASGKVEIVGGMKKYTELNNISDIFDDLNNNGEIFDPSQKYFELIRNRMNIGRSNHVSVLGAKGQSYIIGGSVRGAARSIVILNYFEMPFQK